jgi:hypothetical protein
MLDSCQKLDATEHLRKEARKMDWNGNSVKRLFF